MRMLEGLYAFRGDHMICRSALTRQRTSPAAMSQLAFILTSTFIHLQQWLRLSLRVRHNSARDRRGKKKTEREGEERNLIPLHWKRDTKDNIVVGSFGPLGSWRDAERVGAADCPHSAKCLSQGHLTHRKLHVMTSTPGLDTPAEGGSSQL